MGRLRATWKLQQGGEHQHLQSVQYRWYGKWSSWVGSWQRGSLTPALPVMNNIASATAAAACSMASPYRTSAAAAAAAAHIIAVSPAATEDMVQQQQKQQQVRCLMGLLDLGLL